MTIGRSFTLSGFCAGASSGHEKDQAQFVFCETAEQAPELFENARVFARAAPECAASGFALRRFRYFWRLLAVVKQPVHGDFECVGELLERLNAGHGVAILDAGDVATKQASALFDIALGQFFSFTQQTYTVTNYHVRHCFMVELPLQAKIGNRPNSRVTRIA